MSTGETGDPALAQERDNLAGKILRITPKGKPAPGNPFGNEIWSWGHRNIQGLAFTDTGQLWASEFGQNTFDELNRIDAGANYGWPEFEGEGGTDAGFVDPQAVWGTDVASPSGLAFADGALYMAALRGNRLWRIPRRVRGRRRPAGGLLRRRVRPDAHRGRRPRRLAVADHVQPRRPGLARRRRRPDPAGHPA